MRTKGWQKVFSFTLVQYIKTKSFIVGTIIMCVIISALCVLTNVLPVLLDNDDANVGGILGGENSDNPAEQLNAIYIIDETGILTAEDSALLEDLLPERITASDKTLEELVEQMSTAEDFRTAVNVTAALDDAGGVIGYNIKTYYSPETDGKAVDTLNALVSEIINRRKMLNAGVAPENYAQTQLWVTTSKVSAGAEEWNIIQSALNYCVPIVVSIVLFVLVFSYGQVVAQSIATEKTSRVMELLLTSVRPLAVVIGKVLSMGVVSFGQFILIGLVGALSFMLSAPFGFIGKIFEIVNNPEIQQLVSQGLPGLGAQSGDVQIAEAFNEFTSSFNAFNIILIVVIFLLGFLFFSLIAALVGASISRMEDLQQAMQPYSILGLVGVYLAYVPVIFNIGSMETGEATTNPVQIFSYFFPISSPFALPSAILLGTLDLWQSLLGIAVLAAAVILAAVVVGKVYEAIILHNGNRIKFGDILKMAARK